MLADGLEKVAQGEDLSHEEMAGVIGAIVGGESSPAQVAGFLVGLRVKGETVEELAGAAATFRRLAVAVPANDRPRLCTAGTGGDRKGTLNLSTAAALVAAAAGVTVAKHGNRSVSSKCGSADLLEALGIPIGLDPDGAAAALGSAGFAFLFAPNYHPAMKSVAPIRRDLAVRTLFNLLGPLTNPARVTAQLVGVYDPAKMSLMASVLASLDVERALVVSAVCGLDEISPEGETRVVEMAGGVQRDYVVVPEDFGLRSVPLDTIRGGSPEENAATLKAVLEGAHHPARTGVLLNAAAALYAAGAVDSLRGGAALAAETIASGRVGALIAGLAAPERSAA
ncbi:MAG: anthranilate phosphoribosyltransferase [Bauldia litoralis]